MERRIGLLIIGLAALIALVGGGVSILLTQAVLRSSVDAQLHTISDHSHSSIEDLAYETPPGSVVIWRESSGTKVRARGAHAVVSAADRRALETVLRGRTGLSSISLPDRDDMRVLVTDKPRHRELVAVNVDSTERDLARLGALEFLAWIVCGFVAAVIGVVVTRHVTRPLREVARTASGIAAEPVDSVAAAVTRRVDDRQSTVVEVDAVVQSMNALLRQIESAMRRRDESEEALRTFLADVSHELRTPIAVVRSHAELSRHRMVAGEREKDAGPGGVADDALLGSLERIERESDRMGRLVDDLLLLARLDGTKRPDVTRVDLTYVAVETLSDAKVLSSDHVWAFEAPDSPIEVVAAEDAVRRVLTNLVTNARKHTPAGTRVTVALGKAEAWAWLRVSDDGPGLPPHVAHAPGERFTGRNRADSTSTGLGLAITRSLVESMQGHIEFQSDSSGTAVTVQLPAEATPASSDDVADAQSAAPRA